MALKVNVNRSWKEMSAMKINLDKPHFLFDGSSNGIVIGDVTTYDGLTGFTIECWVRLTLRNTVSIQGIVSKGPYYSTSSSFNLCLMERSVSSPSTQINRLEFSVSNGYHWVNLGTGFKTNTWHHIAITLEGSSIKIYLDGVLKGSSTRGVPIPNTYASLNIGQTPDGAINGGIGEIRFWNYAKTLSQIQDQMNLELDGNEIGLLGLYQASKQTLPLTSGSNVIYDSTSTGNNGTINTTLGDSISYDYLESYGMKINLDTNIDDYSDWTVGVGSSAGHGAWYSHSSVSNWTQVGRVNSIDPFGTEQVVWDVIGTGTTPTYFSNISGYTFGGLSGGVYLPVDQTKLYRYSMWVNRVSSGDTAAISGEMMYYGLYNYNQAHTNTGATYVTNGYYGTNIYFIYQTPVLSTTYPINTWQLLVGHMFPYTWTGTTNHPNTGIWRNGINVGELNGNIKDVKFNFNTYYTSMRAYLPYVGGRYCHWQAAYPRLDLVDGTEPSITTLLNNEGPWRTATAGWINIGDSWKKFL